MVMQWLKYSSILVMCFMCWSGLAVAAVTAHVDRFNISEGETVNLTIEVTGSDSGEPQTAPLQKDFEILSNNHSSSFTIVNGSTNSKSVYQWMLRPRHAGPITIPPLQVGATATRPIMLQVSKIEARTSPAGHPSGDLWISMDVAPKQVRVQQQAIITIRVYQAVALNQAQLSEPEAEHAVIERLGDDAIYQKRDNGRTWQVTERHYALFPQQSGHIEITPVQLDGSVLTGGASFFQSARPVRKLSNALGLEVSGIPAGWKGGDWLPAKNLRIEESWSSGATFKVGEPITRTLTLHADGLSASQLPGFASDLPDHLKSYADKPVLQDDKKPDGVHGMRQEKIAIMPMQPGTYILPEINVDWWNTATKQTEHATLPARTFTVSAAAHTQTTTPPPLQKSLKNTRLGNNAVAAPTRQLAANSVASWWQWLAIFSTAGWLLTLVYIGLQRRNGNIKGRHVTHRMDSENLKQAEKAVKTACKQNEAKDCEQALLHLAHIRFDATPIHSLAALAHYCDGALKSQVLNLERLLYAADKPEWQGEALWRAFQQSNGFTAPEQETAGHQDKPLPELYPG